MTVFENVALGLHARPNYSLTDALFCTPRSIRREKQNIERANGLLDLVGLSAYAKKHAGDLSYGLQRRLELVRAMATDPQLLLLDEPAAGMNEDECGNLTKLIRSIHQEFGFGVILIEHHIQVGHGAVPRVPDLRDEPRRNPGLGDAHGDPERHEGDQRISRGEKDHQWKNKAPDISKLLSST
jgi:ABC-type branched-subunit amino acid transport system ATPase component